MTDPQLAAEIARMKREDPDGFSALWDQAREWFFSDYVPGFVHTELHKAVAAGRVQDLGNGLFRTVRTDEDHES